jgi:hypothetical protein
MYVSAAIRMIRLRAGWCRLSVLLLTAWAGLPGCGRSDKLPALTVYEVKGKVVLANGQPLRGGFISFVPKGDLPVVPSGTIGSDGTFSIVTGGSGEGAPTGDYKVRVESPEFERVGTKSKKPLLFPLKYTDEDSSGLVITVRPEANHLEPIVLK